MLLSSRQLFSQIQQRLQAIYPVEEARQITFLLLESCYQLTRTDVLADKTITGQESSPIDMMVKRLLKHEPVQYLLGRTSFYGRWFKVDPSVLIPRPETEELVQWIIRENSPAQARPLVIVDLGTGSGCIAVTLAAEMPQAEVWAVDISRKALQVAKENAGLNRVNVRFIEADILQQGWQKKIPMPQADLIVSNPPYITYAEIDLMRKNVIDYEPHLALFVENPDALLFYRHIAGTGVSLLKQGGLCYVETNENYTRQVENIFIEYNYSGVARRQDLFGKERFVKAVKP